MDFLKLFFACELLRFKQYFDVGLIVKSTQQLYSAHSNRGTCDNDN